MSHTRLTSETYEQIRQWVAQDVRAEEIAARLGVTVNTLRVQCCRRKVSLRTKLPRRKRDQEMRTVCVLLPRPLAKQLRACARSRGMHECDLAATLLTAIAADNLYDAVLDGG